MADMINIHRAFETYQKIIQQLTDQDKLATSKVGQV
jgi:flagellar basal body rod protein FlgG